MMCLVQEFVRGLGMRLRDRGRHEQPTLRACVPDHGSVTSKNRKHFFSTKKIILWHDKCFFFHDERTRARWPIRADFLVGVLVRVGVWPSSSLHVERSATGVRRRA